MKICAVRGRFDVEDIRAALRVTAVLDWFGVEYRDRPEIRLATCPACGERQRRASFLVDRETGKYFHHGGSGGPDGGPCRGDIFSLVAELAGISLFEFSRIVELAAQIAGMTPDADPEESAHRRAESKKRLEAFAHQAAEERRAAEARVPRLWSALAERHPERGEPYLMSRGLEPSALAGVVRYRADGAPCVLLHDLETCAPINIATRQIDREPKILTLDIRRTLRRLDCRGSHSTVGTLVGRIDELDTTGGGPDVAILVEGVADTLAAVLAFPGCVVFGANGWHHMEAIAAAIAPRVVEARGWLLVGVHDDEQGIAGAGDAMRAAIDAGLVLDQSVRPIDTSPHKDLADAWRAGWRWSWPDVIGSSHGGRP